jgi:hypothetical protein
MACENVDAINAALLTAVTAPSYIQTDAGTVSQHSLPDLIKVASYLAGTCAGSNKRQGLRFSQLIPGGTVQGFCGRRFR